MSLDLYEIGVELILDDGIIGQLEATETKFTELQKIIDSTNASLGTTKGLVSDVASAASGMATSWSAAATAAEQMAAAANSMAGAAPGGGGGGAPAAPGGNPVLLQGETPYVMPGDSGGGGSNVPAVIPGQGTYTHGAGSTTPIDDQPFSPRSSEIPPISLKPGWDDDVVKGGGLGFGLSDLFFGKAVLDMGGNIVAAGYGTVSQPQDQVTRMRLNDKNFSQADADKALAGAKELVSQVPGLSLTGAMTIIAQGYQQTRNIDTAIAMAKPLAEDAAVLSASGDADAVNQLFDLQRAAELAGTLNDKNSDGSIDINPFTNWVNNATKIAQSTPGVDPHQIMLQTQQNDVGAMANDQEGQSYDDILISALGGYKSGTGLAALNREFTGGKMSTGTEGVLERLGLIDPAGATKTGQYYTLKPGALKDQALFDSDPVKWLETTFTDAVNKMSPDDRNAMLHDIYSGTGTASGARVAGDAVLQDTFIARQLYYAQQDTPDIWQSIADVANNPSTAAKTLGNSISNVWNTALSPSAPRAVSAENWLAGRWDDIAAHPAQNLENTLYNLTQSPAEQYVNSGQAGADIGSFMSAIVSALHTLFVTDLGGGLTNIVKAIEGQPGGSASNPAYVKPVTGPAGTPMPTSPTGHNPAQSPPVPGQVFNPP